MEQVPEWVPPGSINVVEVLGKLVILSERDGLLTVGVDLGSTPLDEVLAFRREHFKEHRAYARAVRRFVEDVSRIPERRRARVLKDRMEELQDIASHLKALSRKSWRRPATFALSIAGAAWTLKTGDPVGALLAAGAAILVTGESPQTTLGDANAYSYLFSAASRYAR